MWVRNNLKDKKREKILVLLKNKIFVEFTHVFYRFRIKYIFLWEISKTPPPRRRHQMESSEEFRTSSTIIRVNLEVVCCLCTVYS